MKKYFHKVEKRFQFGNDFTVEKRNKIKYFHIPDLKKKSLNSNKNETEKAFSA